MAEPILKLDFSAFQKMADRIGVAQQQLPFALSRALNQSAFAARTDLIGSFPTFTHGRNTGFARYALGVEPSTKTELVVRITNKRTAGRDILPQLVDGGTHTGRGNIAVPVGGQRRGVRGIVPSQRPRNVRNAFKRGDAIYARVGKGRKEKLKLLYVLKGGVLVPRTWPARDIFRESMIREMQVRAPAEMLKAMQTAIKR